MPQDPLLLMVALALFFIAALYSSVGHGGASGYLAVLALAGLAPEELRPTALALNIIVAGIAAWRFARSGNLRMPILRPFLIASVPAAFLAGRFLLLEAAVYQWLLGAVLLYAAWRLLATREPAAVTARPVGLWAGLIAGAMIGAISGAIGVGGGIFLSPLLMLMGWATARQAAAAAAPFILLNSIAGLAGVGLQHGGLPVAPLALLVPGIAVLLGGLIGSWLGAERLNQRILCRILGIVLIIAAMKMFVA